MELKFLGATAPQPVNRFSPNFQEIFFYYMLKLSCVVDEGIAPYACATAAYAGFWALAYLFTIELGEVALEVSLLPAHKRVLILSLM